jgi:hypothetical protein
MNAVMLVRWRELGGRLRFWIAIVNYDPRDRSLNQILYLIYVVIFFSVWGFALLALLADVAANALSMVSRLSPCTAAIWLFAAILFFKSCVHAFLAGVRSPFISSETDAELLCQTPIERSKVALFWFMETWLPTSLLYSALAVVLRFATMQLSEPAGFQWPMLPSYILAGLATVSIVLPLDLAMTAPGHTLGALRLHADREIQWLRWIPGAVMGILLAIVYFYPAPANLVLWPVLFPIWSVICAGSWWLGIIVAVMVAALSGLILYWASSGLNLSRAAQESRSRWAQQQTAWLGASSLGQEMRARQKLGSGHGLSRLPGKEGPLVLVWKDFVVSARLPKLGPLLAWLGIAFASTGWILNLDFGTRLWAFIFWAILVAQRCTGRLRSNLRVWNLTHQLPFSGREVLLAEIGVPSLLTILISWLSFILSFYLGSPPAAYLILLIPAAVLCISLSAAYDILRHCQASELLTGFVAELGAGGVLLGIILAVLPVLLVFVLVSLKPAFGLVFLSSLLGLLLGAGGVYLAWHLAAQSYSKIK